MELKQRLIQILKTLTEEDGNFEDPGWMEDAISELVQRDNVLLFIDDLGCVAAFIGYWRFGEKRWKFIKKLRDVTSKPQQMHKGKHLYIPLIVVRHDMEGTISLKKFLSSLKSRVPDATTISWHDNFGKFRTYKIVRRKDHVSIQEEGCSISHAS